MPKIDVAYFESGQEKAISEIHNQAFRQWIQLLGQLYGYREIVPEDISSWSADPKSTIWIVFLQGEPVGYVHCFLEERVGLRPIKSLAFVETIEHLGQSKIAVLPAFQRKGIAEALLKVIIDYYQQLGVETATAIAYNDNIGASALFSKLGFEHKQFYYYEHYSQNDPFIQDAVLATLDLQAPIREPKLSPNVFIRPLQENDLSAMKAIFGECRPDVFGKSPAHDQIEGWLHSSWAEETLVAEIDGKVVGCMEYTSSGIIGIPGVLKKYRRAGVGSTLIYHLLKAMQERGFTTALADTGCIMQDAIQMYQQFGFNLTREQWAWVKIL
ncbi:MAG: GNAT family N-acetyltransferase [Candidatus Hodarchaeota archaeon]